MSSLFPVDPAFPEGFSYYPDFLSTQEEEDLLRVIRTLHLHQFIFQGFEAKRRVASFGFDYHFDQKRLTAGNPIPEALEPLVHKVADHLSLHSQELAELLVTEYPPGAVINWHRDAPPFKLIAGISLLEDCVFRLRPYDKKLRTRKSTISFPVRRRSLYVMDCTARADWEHSIAPVQHTRYSITLRTLHK
jgi:alkylated DNA repair dioxygenase AlkB